MTREHLPPKKIEAVADTNEDPAGFVAQEVDPTAYMVDLPDDVASLEVGRKELAKIKGILGMEQAPASEGTMPPEVLDAMRKKQFEAEARLQAKTEEKRIADAAKIRNTVTVGHLPEPKPRRR